MKPFAVCLLFAASLFAQPKYTGPKPEKKDLPYLVHADNLIPTESVSATEQQKKDETTYVINGDKSTARTPLASPIFVMDSASIPADRLQVFRLDVKSGHREITIKKKGPSEILHLTITPVSGTLYRIEVDESLPPGQYSLSPSGSNATFCFEVY